MCGITGVVDTKEITSSDLRKATEILRNRGPDAQEFFIDSKVGLGHNRLAIIDIQGGRQPMEDDGVVLSFNGQIYNFRKIREKLELLGIRFNTNSDTEVLLKLFIEKREKAFPEFNGMFAISIWDSNLNELFLARDRSGIKPLFYTQINDKLIFGSEIKAILMHPEFTKRELNLYAFHLFFNLRFVPEEHTFFKGIKQLKAGECLKWKNGQVKINRYWNPSEKMKYDYNEPSPKILRKLLEQSLDIHLISDVEIGSFLSGGIDSTTIVALASERVENLKAFTLGFDQETDEIKNARLTAEYYNLDHYEKIVPDTFLDDSPLILWHSEFPKRNLYTYYIAKFASEKVKVVLSGLGSDELFGGYHWKYDNLKRNQKYLKLHEKRIVQIKESAKYLTYFQSKYESIEKAESIEYLENLQYIDNPLETYTQRISLDEVYNKERRERWYGDKLRACNFPDISHEMKQYFSSENPFSSILKADFFSKMIGDFLQVDDRTCMAVSVEGRLPFLENSIIDFSFETNPNLHIQGRGKHLLRKAMNDKLPDWVKNAPKQGFTIFLNKNYINNIIEYSKLLLLNGHIIQNKLISKEFIEKIISLPPRDNFTKHYYILWNLLYFEIWYEVFMARNLTKTPNFKVSDMLT